MSTRSDIIVHRADDKWARVYCHFDGYLEGVGQVLSDHYRDQAKAEALVAPGDMSSLDAKCDKPVGHSYENQVPGHTVYYGRDRGETDVDAAVAGSLKEVWARRGSDTEFVYVWDAGNWWVGDPEGPATNLIDLADALAGKKTIHPALAAFGLANGR